MYGNVTENKYENVSLFEVFLRVYKNYPVERIYELFKALATYFPTVVMCITYILKHSLKYFVIMFTKNTYFFKNI